MFSYDLPKERIAAWPVSLTRSRDESRLLHAVMRSEKDVKIQDRSFFELPGILKRGDLLVLNNSAVLARRYFCTRIGDDYNFELLLSRQIEVDTWEAVGKPLAKLKEGDVLKLSPHLTATSQGRTQCGRRVVLRLEHSDHPDAIERELDEAGVMPIPPYIRDGVGESKDRELYQTVYADKRGSIAAPTAGLHFTDLLLEKLERAGIDHCFLTLHVGTASLTPIREGSRVDKEQYLVSTGTWDKIQEAKKDGRRVVAVGTTAVRALESTAKLKEFDRFVETELFITPGFKFEVVDSLITNFHQPDSTHLQLVSAFLSPDCIEKIYQHGLGGEYRFLSYGDSMFLER